MLTKQSSGLELNSLHAGRVADPIILFVLSKATCLVYSKKEFALSFHPGLFERAPLPNYMWKVAVSADLVPFPRVVREGILSKRRRGSGERFPRITAGLRKTEISAPSQLARGITTTTTR
jgi:hypothetical protein